MKKQQAGWAGTVHGYPSKQVLTTVQLYHVIFATKIFRLRFHKVRHSNFAHEPFGFRMEIVVPLSPVSCLVCPVFASELRTCSVNLLGPVGRFLRTCSWGLLERMLVLVIRMCENNCRETYHSAHMYSTYVCMIGCWVYTSLFLSCQLVIHFNDISTFNRMFQSPVTMPCPIRRPTRKRWPYQTALDINLVKNWHKSWFADWRNMSTDSESCKEASWFDDSLCIGVDCVRGMGHRNAVISYTS